MPSIRIFTDFPVKKLFSLSLIIAGISALVSCGGGGGGTSSAESSATQYSYVALKYHDAWQKSVTHQTVGGVQTTSKIDYQVDAVNPGESYAVSIYDEDRQESDSELWGLDGQVLISPSCTFSPKQDYLDFPLFVGKTWHKTFSENCSNITQSSVDGHVLGEETITTPAGNFHTLKIGMTLAFNGDDPSNPISAQVTCWWSTELGIYAQCNTSNLYANPTADLISTISTELQVTAFNRGDLAPVALSTTYPAFHPETPQVGPPRLGASPVVLQSPKIIPVFFSDTPNQSKYVDFLAKLTASSEWGLLAEYGVGNAVVASPMMLVMPAPATTTGDNIAAWIASQAQSWSGINANTLLVIFYPASTKIDMSGSGDILCDAAGAYHDNVTLNNSTKLSYAIIPDCQSGFGVTTSATSHEIFEAVTDPFETGFVEVTEDGGWSEAYGGAELADLCEERTDFNSYPADIGYPIFRIWSNNGARAGLDPCSPISPVTAHAPYFNSAPVLPDVVSVNGKLAKGIVVPAGNTRIIDVQLFSSAPTNGDWYVVAVQNDPPMNDANRLGLNFDKTGGQNGDTLHLMIGAPTLPNGATFTIYSVYGGVVTSWVGAVANNPAPPLAVTSVISATPSYGVTSDQITLDGTGSSSSDNAVLQYHWTQLSGASVNLSSPNSAVTTFTVPSVPSPTYYPSNNLVFQLTTTHPNGQINSSTTNVFAYNSLSDAAVLKLRGDAGDVLSNGATFSWGGPQDLSFSSTVPAGGENELTIKVGALYYVVPLWTISITAPGATNLQTGVYSATVAQPDPNGNTPGLMISNGSSICNSPTGQFTISELNNFHWSGLVFILGNLALDFDLHCQNSIPGADIHGTLRVRSSVPPLW